jgi:hypothetical protein
MLRRIFVGCRRLLVFGPSTNRDFVFQNTTDHSSRPPTELLLPHGDLDLSVTLFPSDSSRLREGEDFIWVVK